MTVHPLNRFSQEVLYGFGEEMAIHIATQSANPPICTGDDWERIFASCVGTTWRKSMDFADIKKAPTGWSAKTKEVASPLTCKHVSLISARITIEDAGLLTASATPNDIGNALLTIWNSRVESAQASCPDLRTVVLLRNETLTEFCIFEFPTPICAYTYEWSWNTRRLLDGYHDGKKKFTWGTNTTLYIYEDIIEPTRLRLAPTPRVERKSVLKTIGYKPEALEIVESPTGPTQFPVNHPMIRRATLDGLFEENVEQKGA